MLFPHAAACGRVFDDVHICMAQHVGKTVGQQHGCVWCTEMIRIAKKERLDYCKAFSSATKKCFVFSAFEGSVVYNFSHVLLYLYVLLLE